MFTNLIQTYPEQKIRKMMKTLMNLVHNMEVSPLVAVFYYSQTLKSMLIEYAAKEMGFLHDYYDADPNHRIIRVNGSPTYIFHVAQCIIFCRTNYVKKILIANASSKSFYSRLGFTVIKDFVTYTTFEAACSQFHYEKGKYKTEQK